MKQKACGTLAFSKLLIETADQLMSLLWRAKILRHFEEEIQTTPKILALIAILSCKPYIVSVRTELQPKLAWCLTALTMGEYDSKKGVGQKR